MAVTEDVQGLGIGRKLIEACISLARTDGSTAIVLETAEELKSAVHLYEKMGFIRFNLPHAHYTYNRPVFAMKMDL
jgi:ribosomal protein S18 acetylase RimI-like enzyme